MIRRPLRVLLCLPLALAWLWAAAALWIDGAPPPLGVALCVLLLVLVLWRLRAFWPCFLTLSALWLAVLLWWLSLAPSNTRNWREDVAHSPWVEHLADGRWVFHALRNFEYRSSDSDYRARWETRTVDPARITGLNLYLSFWGPTLYAHSFLAWEFSDAAPLAISIETRKEQGEDYSAWRGFFRQYERYNVVGDERDLVGVRAIHRGERVFRYPLQVSPAQARALLAQYVADINALHHQPSWYNALSANCTTAAYRLAGEVADLQGWLDWRLLANGYLDEWLLAHQLIATDLPLAELRANSEATARAQAAGQAADFSRRIRLPN